MIWVRGWVGRWVGRWGDGWVWVGPSGLGWAVKLERKRPIYFLIH